MAPACQQTGPRTFSDGYHTRVFNKSSKYKGKAQTALIIYNHDLAVQYWFLHCNRDVLTILINAVLSRR